MKKKDKQAALEAIARGIAACKQCLKNKTGKLVAGEGNPDAAVVFIGEAPGKTEAATGRPFVGRAGKLLRQLIAEAGLKEEDVFITSVIKHLPKHVTPTDEEIAHERPYLLRQLDIIEPEVVVLLGRTAVKGVLQKNINMTADHGNVIEQDKRKYLVSYHPAAPLYSNAALGKIQDDFKILKQLLGRVA